MTVPRFQVALMDTVIPPQAGLTPSGIGAAGAGGATVPQTFYRPSGNFPEETYYPMAWLAMLVGVASPTLSNVASFGSIFGRTDTFSEQYGRHVASFTYGALPNPAPAPDGYTLAAPHLLIRAAPL